MYTNDYVAMIDAKQQAADWQRSARQSRLAAEARAGGVTPSGSGGPRKPGSLVRALVGAGVAAVFLLTHR